MFPVVIVAPNAPRGQEQLGSKPKFWYDDPNLGLCLFKEVRPGTGEDWAEKIAEHVCRNVGLPHARYELAEYNGKRGVVTPVIHRLAERLIMGNELLGQFVTEYEGSTDPYGRNRLHTCENVLRRLEAYQPPDGFEPLPGVATGADVFLGYLMLDMLIGNSDRHHENWACIAASNGTKVRLAPTYDHASSLGRELKNERREAQLTTKDQNQTVEAYARKARSGLYRGPQDNRPMTVQEAVQAAATRRTEAARTWLRCFQNGAEDAVREGFARLPAERTHVSHAQFAERMVSYNLRRLTETMEAFS